MAKGKHSYFHEIVLKIVNNCPTNLSPQFCDGQINKIVNLSTLKQQDGFSVTIGLLDQMTSNSNIKLNEF